LVVTLVLLGLAAALAVGYVVGGNSRDDDVKSADAQANKAQKALEEEQNKDSQAVEAITGAFQSLGDAIAQQDAADDQQAQEAVDEATAEIQRSLDQLGAEAQADVNQAVTELRGKINDAIGSAGGESP
jgi:F0F1-type ATP synthase membrane subunit b/b'